MRIAIASMWFPVSISRYFLVALQHMDCDVITVGPTSVPTIPWGANFNYPEHAFTPDFQTSFDSQEAGQQVASIIERGELADIDLWIDVDAGFFVDCKMPWLHAGIMTDPHVLNYDKQRALWDESFCMQSVYATADDHVLPYAYCPHTHYFEEGVEQTHDVSNLGLQYTNRVAVTESLVAGGLRVLGKLGLVWDEYRRGLLSAPICFTWSSQMDAIARCWEALATKRLLICNRVPGLKEHFEEGKHYIAFSDFNEALQKTLFYSGDSYMAGKIAEAGHLAVQSHTYEARLQQVFDEVLS